MQGRRFRVLHLVKDVDVHCCGYHQRGHDEPPQDESRESASSQVLMGTTPRAAPYLSSNCRLTLDRRRQGNLELMWPDRVRHTIRDVDASHAADVRPRVRRAPSTGIVPAIHVRRRCHDLLRVYEATNALLERTYAYRAPRM
jgi:hypothetical protein